MAERGPDRDGLELDELTVVVGPWLPALPPGLRLRIAFQGDVLQRVEVQASPSTPATQDDPFRTALAAPVPVRDLEIARARHLLRAVAEALRVQGLAVLARRVLSLAERAGPDDAPAVDALAAAVRRSGVLRFVLRGVGRLDPDQVGGLGPVARATGTEDDARIDDPGYRALGFSPVVTRGGDAAARLRQRLAEAAASLRLAGDAGDATSGGTGIVETPRGRLVAGEPTPEERLLGLLSDLLVGLEWGDAVQAIQSLDVEPAGVEVPV